MDESMISREERERELSIYTLIEKVILCSEFVIIKNAIRK